MARVPATCCGLHCHFAAGKTPLFDPVLLLLTGLLGAFAGFIGGMLGIGGGVIIVPVLVLLFDARLAAGQDLVTADAITNVAVATSLASIVFTSFAAARAQFARGAVRMDIVRVWAPCVIGGSFLAGFIAAELPALYLRTFIGAFLTVVSLIMLSSWQPPPHRTLPGGIGSSTRASAAGLVAGLAGIGGGNVIVPTLIYYNIPMHGAAATASALGVPIAAFGAIGYAISGWAQPDLPVGNVGFVSLPLVAALIIPSMLTAPLGVAVAHRMPAAVLKRAFGAVLLLVAARILYSLL